MRCRQADKWLLPAVGHPWPRFSVGGMAEVDLQGCQGTVEKHDSNLMNTLARSVVLAYGQHGQSCTHAQHSRPSCSFNVTRNRTNRTNREGQGARSSANPAVLWPNSARHTGAQARPRRRSSTITDRIANCPSFSTCSTTFSAEPCTAGSNPCHLPRYSSQTVLLRPASTAAGCCWQAWMAAAMRSARLRGGPAAAAAAGCCCGAGGPA